METRVMDTSKLSTAMWQHRGDETGQHTSNMTTRRRRGGREEKHVGSMTAHNDKLSISIRQAGAKCPAAGKQKGNKLGKAHALPTQKMWEAWLGFVKEHSSGGPKLFFLLWLTAALCLRVTQVAQLLATDIDWASGTVFIKAFKGHAASRKKLLPASLAALKKWRATGICSGTIAKQHGGRGLVTMRRTYFPPHVGFLFESRSGAKIPHLGKDTVAAAIRKIRVDFVKSCCEKWPDLSDQQVRSHSGRRHAITWMVSHGVSDHVGMSFAQIDNPQVYAGYSQLHYEQIAETLGKVDRMSPLARSDCTAKRRCRR
jgi:integrase